MSYRVNPDWRKNWLSKQYTSNRSDQGNQQMNFGDKGKYDKKFQEKNL